MFRFLASEQSMPFAPLARAGALVLKTIEAADQPFDEQLARGDGKLMAVSFETPDRAPFTLGTPGNLQLQLGTGGEALLDIIWPDEPEAQQALLHDYGLSFKDGRQIYLAFVSRGRATLGAGAAFPSGPLSATFGIRAGGEAGFVYLKPFDRDRQAGDVLRAFFKDMRLPYDVTTVEAIPAEGEVLAFSYGGYLSVGAAAAWGYSVSKYDDVELGNLRLSQRVDIASALKLGTQIRVAGTHSMEVRRGAEPGWVRIVARKHREGSFSVAADLSIATTLETQGLPEDADQFLEALLDLRTPDVARDVLQVLDAGPEAFFTRLQAAAQGLTDRFLNTLFERWFDAALTSSTATAFFERLQGVLRLYEEVGRLDERAVAVLEAYAERAEALKQRIERVLHLPDRAALEDVTEADFWTFLQQYLGDGLFAFLTSDEAFEEVRSRLAAWTSKEWETLLSFVQARRKALDLPVLLEALEALTVRLEQVDTPEEVRRLAEGYLLDLAHRLTGKAFDTLEGSRLKEALASLQTLLHRLRGFRSTLYAQFAAALNDTHKLDLSWRYARATERDALLDVEINLQQNAALVQRALHGDFTELARIDDPDLVKIHPSLLTLQTRRTSQLKVDVLGWKYERLHDLVFRTEETLRQQGPGLLHVYHLKAEEQVSRRRRDEEVKMQFLFGLLAEGRKPDLVETVSRLSADYAFDIEDAKTSERELKAYLRLAEHLRLLQGTTVEDLLEAFRQQLGIRDDRGWGAVSLKYQVQYDPEALLGVFRLLPVPSIKGIARQAFRNITAANYRNFGGTQYEALARMLLDDRIYWTWKTPAAHLNAESTFCYDVEVDGEKHKACVDRFRRNVLHILYGVEDDLVEALLDLDAVLDRAREAGAKPGKQELEKAFQRLVRQRRELEKWMTLQEADRYVNPLFAVLDQLIAVLSASKATRATLQLTFNRQGLEPVTKVFVSRPDTAE